MDKIRSEIGKEVKVKVNNITDKALFCELIDSKFSGMLHYKEISYQENVEYLKKYKKNDTLTVKILEIKDDKIRFSKRAARKSAGVEMLPTPGVIFLLLFRRGG